MSKFCGKVGYANTEEVRPGVWEDAITERTYYGDVYELRSQWEKSGGVNDNITIRHQISILADGFAYEHFSKIRYVEWMGAKFKVTDVKLQRPRLTLTIGGEWNE